MAVSDRVVVKPCKVLCLALYPQGGPSVRHRVLAYMPYWHRADIRLTFWPFMTVRLFRTRRLFGFFSTVEKVAHFIFCSLRLLIRVPLVVFFDVVIIHREVFPLGAPLFEKLVMWLNPNVIYDLDDAIWHEPSNDVNQRKLFWCPSRVSSIIRGCAQTVSGSPYIADYASRFSDNVSIIPTSYDSLASVSNSHSGDSSPVIVWIGNIGNAFYLKSIIPLLNELSEEYRFTLRLIGGSDIYDIRSSHFEVEYHNWSKQVERELLVRSDIGIMPLVNGAFEQGKCSFKIIQYFSAFLPVIASPVGMNASILQHGKSGYLASTVDEWRGAFRALLHSKKLRNSMGKEGNRVFIRDYSREVNADRWSELILTLHQVEAN